MNNLFLSVVIPVYNDEEVLEELYRRLKPVIDSITEKYEIIFVDDGSKDKSFDKLIDLYQKDDNIRIIKFSKNFGQQNSIAAGLEHSKGDLVVLMDSDLQDRPEDIPKLINAMKENNVSMAIAKWKTRDDSFFKVLVSKLFYNVSKKITSIQHPPNVGGFRVIGKNVIDEIKKINEKTGTTISLIYWAGFKYVTVDVERDARFAGKSGYNIKKMFKLAFDRIFSYSLFPIRVANFIGLSLSIIGFFYGAYLLIERLTGTKFSPGWTSIIVLVLFLSGIQFILMGVIGEYLGRIYLEAKGRPKYIIENYISKNKD
ncbi:MAG: glycosyltransferase family 2 protein [Candidatus Kapabacteria bacterium]|nr:glycosyltransferase family 2 protein [Candidatus Kapabacteria bacterium]